MEFNPNPPTVMHVDINSCFATIEQQANPLLRGVPTVVAAYVQDHGCILAASREAKKLGIQTGMRVREAKSIFKHVAVLPPDPNKYRFVNKKLQVILGSYTPYVSVESIDEMVLSLAHTPALEHIVQQTYPPTTESAMIGLAREIKQRIKAEIGEWITVSIGIAPNRYLAKVASGLHKPDGLDTITRETIEATLSGMRLEELCGIKEGNGNRLRCARITSPLEMYKADALGLEQAFHSIVGYYWSRIILLLKFA